MLKPALPIHVKTEQLVGRQINSTHTHTHAHMEPYPQHQAFVSRYVHGGAPYGSRHGYGVPRFLNCTSISLRSENPTAPSSLSQIRTEVRCCT